MPVAALTSTVGGVRSAYWQYGDGDERTLVFVHGFRGDHHGLELIAKECLQKLAFQGKSYRIIIPDLPGFGQSELLTEKHDLCAYGIWLKQFLAQFEYPDVIAHSFGTLVTAQTIAQGAKMRSLTLINPISAPALQGPRKILTGLTRGYYKTAKMLPKKFADPLLSSPAIVRGMSELMAKTGDKKLRAWIHTQHAEYFSSYRDRGALLEAFEASISHTVTDFAASITMPTTVIAGAKDDITPLAKQLELVNMLRDARLEVVGGVGHLIHYEAAAEAAELIIRRLENS